MIRAYRHTPWGIMWIGQGPIFWHSLSIWFAREYDDTPENRRMLTDRGYRIEVASHA
jgi:hypothetical protein